MRKRGLWLCCRPVSVRPSVRHIRALYPDGWSDIVKFLSRPGSHVVIALGPQARYTILKGTVSGEVQITRCVRRKLAIFG